MTMKLRDHRPGPKGAVEPVKKNTPLPIRLYGMVLNELSIGTDLFLHFTARKMILD
jgi:hypothetical protein